MNPTQSGHEEWRPVPDYEGLYEVSSQGRVRSLDRTLHTKRGPVRRKGKILRPGTSGPGYPYVNLCVTGDVRSEYVHRLVLTTFVGPCPDGMEGCHNNGDTTDNLLSNLRWDSHKENVGDTIRAGNQRNKRKASCPYGHLYSGNNLILGKNRRTCKACRNARSWVKRYPDQRDRLTEIADAYYGKYMGY